MKKVIVSLALLSWFAVPAFAQSNAKHKSKSCPAAQCTDHSYDHAYTSAAGTGFTESWNADRGHQSCPAAKCTDHSYDKAYSVKNNSNAAENEMEVRASANRRNNVWTPAPVQRGENAYSMNDYTIYGRYTRNAQPNPYNGDDAPSYDGPAKNAYRNMRANNDSEPLPASTGE